MITEIIVKHFVIYEIKAWQLELRWCRDHGNIGPNEAAWSDFVKLSLAMIVVWIVFKFVENFITKMADWERYAFKSRVVVLPLYLQI